MKSLHMYIRKRQQFRGLVIGATFIISCILLALTSSPGRQSSVKAAPLIQSNDPYHLCDLIQEYIIQISTGESDQFDCVGIVKNIGTSSVKISVHIALTQQEARVSAGEGSQVNISQAKYGTVQVGDYGQENWLTWTDDQSLITYGLGFSRGCYAVGISGRSKSEGNTTGIETDAHNWANQIDAKIKALGNTCPRSSGAQPPAPAATQPPAPAQKDFAILGIGCNSTAQLTGQVGRVICYVQTENEPFDDPASYSWTLDSLFAGDKRSMTMDGVSQGEHIVGVTANFHGKNYSYSGWVTVSETGAPAATFELSVSCAYDNAKSTVTCNATPGNPPANAALEYFWFWEGGLDLSKTASLTVNVPKEVRTYQVEVRARDNSSSTYSKVASTSVTTGGTPNVQIPSNIGQAAAQTANTVLTGSANPPKPDPVGATGGGTLVGLGLGLAALANGLLNSAPAGVKQAVTQAAGAVQQAAAEAAKDVKSLPGVKEAQTAVAEALNQTVVDQTVKEAQDFLDGVGVKQSASAAGSKGEPVPIGTEKVKPEAAEAQSKPSAQDEKSADKTIKGETSKVDGDGSEAENQDQINIPGLKSEQTKTTPPRTFDPPDLAAEKQTPQDKPASGEGKTGWDTWGDDEPAKPEDKPTTGSTPKEAQSPWESWKSDPAREELEELAAVPKQPPPYGVFTRKEILDIVKELEQPYTSINQGNDKAISEVRGELTILTNHWVGNDSQINHIKEQIAQALEKGTDSNKLQEMKKSINDLEEKTWEVENEMLSKRQELTNLVFPPQGGLP